FPLLLFASFGLGKWGSLAVAGWLVWIAFFRSTGDPAGWLSYLFCFQLGILVPEAAKHIRLLPRALIQIGFVLAVLTLCLATNLSRMSIMPEHITKEGIASFMIVAVVLSGELGTFGLLRPGVRWLGRISYSLYVFHYPIIAAIEQKGGEHFTFAWAQDHSALFGLGCISIALPFCLAIAWLGWRFVEVPFQRWGTAIARLVLSVRPHRVPPPILQLVEATDT
ncbi:acyltransferase family protein, partial [Bradyrhizobium sp.]|uniref:acyltransferase family protein n=1 Tax=Bradyrhizobium sp. TaxID=376 RepID=UPI003C4A9D37